MLPRDSDAFYTANGEKMIVLLRRFVLPSEFVPAANAATRAGTYSKSIETLLNLLRSMLLPR
jgi:hypothetical protein